MYAMCNNCDILFVGAYYEKGGKPNVSEIKCNENKRKWEKQKTRATCQTYVTIQKTI